MEVRVRLFQLRAASALLSVRGAEAVRVQGTGDDTAYCGICGKETSVAMIGRHLIEEHGIDPDDLANAPVLDLTASADEAKR